MAEQVILDISIPLTDVQKAEQEIGKMRGEVDKLKTANKELEKTSVAYTKNAVEVKRLSGEIRTNERVLVSNTKAQLANEGSVDQLRAQLSKTSIQWAKLSKDERENSEVGKKLTAQKKSETDQLKSLEKQTGDNRRNVGNYSEGMKEALKSSGLFAREQQALAMVQKVVTTTTGGVTTGFKLLRLAFFALGIGAFVALIGTLVSAFLSTQRGVDALNSVIKPLQFAFQRIVGVFQKVATALADLDFRKAWNELKLFGSEVKAGVKDGQDFAKSQIAIKDAQLALATVQGELNRKIQEQKSIVQDVLKTDQERTKAGKEAIDALNQRTDLEANILKEQLKQAQLAANQNDTDRDAKIELAQLTSDLAQLEADRLSASLEIRNQLNGIEKSSIEKSKSLALELSKAQIEQAQITSDEIIRISEEESDKRVLIEMQRSRRVNDQALLALKQSLINEEITRDEYDLKLLEREQNLLNSLRAARVIAGLDTTELDNQLADMQIANIERVKSANQQASAATVAIKGDALDSELGIAKQGVNIAKQAAGDNAEAQKLAGLAAIGINLAETITKASTLGPAGIAFAVLSSAIAAVQTAKIKSTNTNFADGVIGLNGPGTSTSDSISANLSRGESVITAKATTAYAPVLAQMEQAVGNKPNFQMGHKRNFANGIISAGTNPAISSTRAESANLSRASQEFSRQKIYVSIEEFEDKQRDFTEAKQYANIVE